MALFNCKEILFMSGNGSSGGSGGGTGGSGSSLPSISAADDGKVLTAQGGAWVAKEIPVTDGGGSTGTETVPAYTNLADPNGDGWMNGKRPAMSNSSVIEDEPDFITTNYIKVSPNDILRTNLLLRESSAAGNQARITFYRTDKTNDTSMGVWGTTNHPYVVKDEKGICSWKVATKIDGSFFEFDGYIRISAKPAAGQDIIVTVNEEIREVASGGGTSSTDTLPSYWNAHISERISDIKALQEEGGKDCFSFVVISDVHYSQNLGKISPKIAKKVMAACGIKFALCLGDFQNQAASGTTRAGTLKEWDDINEMFAPLRDRALMQLGNHDGAWGEIDTDGDGAFDKYYQYNMKPEELYERVFRNVGMIDGVHFDNSGNAYYVDDTANRVRYILVNTSCNKYQENADGTVANNVMWKQRLTQSQFDFTVAALKSVPSASWSVVVGSHIALINDFDDYTGDRDLFFSVLKAYRSKTSFSGTFGTQGAWDYVSINTDFSDAKGLLVGTFAGHDHKDLYTISDNIPVVLTAADCCMVNGGRVGTLGTTTEQSFSVFTVNKKNGRLYATKIGYGSAFLTGGISWNESSEAGNGTYDLNIADGNGVSY